MSITDRVSEICIEHLDEKEINRGSRNVWSISLPTCLNGSFILVFRKGTLHVCWSLYTLKYGCRWKCAYMTIKISVYASTTLDLVIGYDAINILYTKLWSEIPVFAWCLSYIHYLAQIGEYSYTWDHKHELYIVYFFGGYLLVFGMIYI